ncbi:MAG TPA: CGNR zinc finger domain-containing protein [Gemmatimonadaceae bacterium]|nr:CGNR zinc finger domain-containing protein [Gemmatimonadaceae bacterium]
MPQGFQLVGGHPALDFLNTVHDWTVEKPRDHLESYSDTLRFGVATKTLSARESRRLSVAPAGPNELRRLRTLRSRLERVFRAALVARPMPADLEALARDGAEAARNAKLQVTQRRIVREIPPTEAGAATLRFRLVDAAIALLTSPHIALLKTCPSCGWFFLDTSKNRSRRWCSMAMCGSNAKSRRYYWRTKRKKKR